MTNEQLKDLLTATIAAQSILHANILRAIMQSGGLTEAHLIAALSATEQAAFQRRTPETPALTGLLDLLRRDLGLNEAKHSDAM